MGMEMRVKQIIKEDGVKVNYDKKRVSDLLESLIYDLD